MKGIYVFWSNREDKIMTDYTALTGILSMLYWKKFNGPIKMIADDLSIKFFEKYGFLDLGIIDEIDTTLLTSDKAKTIQNKDCHWTWANIFTINNLKEDAALVDWDNIYKIPFIPGEGTDLTYAHREDLVYPYYPHPRMHIHDYYNSEFAKFPWESKYAFNASFLHFANLELAEKYSYYAMKYILDPNHQSRRNYDYLNVRIVFVDQYLLAEVANTEGYKSDHIFNGIFTPDSNRIWVDDKGEESDYDEKIMYHLWIRKKNVASNWNFYLEYMRSHLNIVKEIFPGFLDQTIKILKPLSEWKKLPDKDILKVKHDSGNYLKYV